MPYPDLNFIFIFNFCQCHVIRLLGIQQEGSAYNQ